MKPLACNQIVEKEFHSWDDGLFLKFLHGSKNSFLRNIFYSQSFSWAMELRNNGLFIDNKLKLSSAIDKVMYLDRVDLFVLKWDGQGFHKIK